MEEQGIGRPSTYAPTVSTILDREYVVKEGKYLHITNLGRVVTALMKERFSDIADLKFTANMEQKLDSVEEGTTAWKDVLREFYGDFEEDLESAEKALDGTRIKVPDEVSEEICPECGRHLVVKSGRFGRFLACPGYPECSFTMPLVVEMPGRCPKCGGRLMKRTGRSKKTGKQYTYYCCEHVNSKDETHKCDFMTWDVPVKDDCPVCGHTMFKKAGKGFKRPFCINPDCANFLPEEKRGYPRKSGGRARTRRLQEDGASARLPGRRRSPQKAAGEAAAAGRRQKDRPRRRQRQDHGKEDHAKTLPPRQPESRRPRRRRRSKPAAKTAKATARKTVASRAKKARRGGADSSRARARSRRRKRERSCSWSRCCCQGGGRYLAASSSVCLRRSAAARRADLQAALPLRAEACRYAWLWRPMLLRSSAGCRRGCSVRVVS